MRRILLLTLTVCFLTACSNNSSNSRAELKPINEVETTIVLLRHAEKAKQQGRDPELSSKGLKRAEALTKKWAALTPEVLYSTPYKRTLMTIAPSSKLLNLPVNTYKVPTELLAKKLLTLHKGQTVVVVGHSNTTPELISALGVKQPITIGHDQYGDLFIVKITKRGASVIREQFGN